MGTRYKAEVCKGRLRGQLTMEMGREEKDGWAGEGKKLAAAGTWSQKI